MKCIKFPETNLVVAENQEEFETIYTHHGKTPDPQDWPVFTVCMELTDDEVQELVKTKKIWYQQIGTQVAPFSLHITKPHLEDINGQG